jgi:hypothetical protein
LIILVLVFTPSVPHPELGYLRVGTCSRRRQLSHKYSIGAKRIKNRVTLGN